jgi:L-seryl-tRNA(Ser) seleniumtransferase
VKLLKGLNGLDVELVDSKAQTGSGALPLEVIPSCAVAIFSSDVGIDDLAARLRQYDPPVVGYVREDRLFLDLRTLWPDDIKDVAEALRWAVENSRQEWNK